VFGQNDKVDIRKLKSPLTTRPFAQPRFCIIVIVPSLLIYFFLYSITVFTAILSEYSAILNTAVANILCAKIVNFTPVLIIGLRLDWDLLYNKEKVNPSICGCKTT
jgi:hypothetical protein